jgi:hypothetical protein
MFMGWTFVRIEVCLHNIYYQNLYPSVFSDQLNASGES